MPLINLNHLEMVLNALDIKHEDTLEMVLNTIDVRCAEVTEEEIIAWLNEEGIVAPVASASGALYTTNKNEIYIL